MKKQYFIMQGNFIIYVSCLLTKKLTDLLIKADYLEIQFELINF